MPGTRTKERQPRDVTINLRANQRQRTLIDQAAETLGKNPSDFWSQPIRSWMNGSTRPLRTKLLPLAPLRGGVGVGAGAVGPSSRRKTFRTLSIPPSGFPMTSLFQNRSTVKP